MNRGVNRPARLVARTLGTSSRVVGLSKAHAVTPGTTGRGRSGSPGRSAFIGLLCLAAYAFGLARAGPHPPAAVLAALGATGDRRAR